jgi:hypothetical protein
MGFRAWEDMVVSRYSPTYRVVLGISLGNKKFPEMAVETSLVLEGQYFQ